MQKKNNFLGIVSEKEGLNKKIATNSEFDFKSNSILEYNHILKNLISHIKIYSKKNGNAKNKLSSARQFVR